MCKSLNDFGKSLVVIATDYFLNEFEITESPYFLEVPAAAPFLECRS